jgi:hypothetical protein
MGAYFIKKKLFEEAEEELKAAVAIDGGLKAQCDALMEQLKAAKEPPKPAVAQSVPEKEKPKDKEVAKEKDKEKEDASASDMPVDLTKRGMEDFLAKFKKHDVAAKTPDEMKAWLEKRKKELEEQIGGTWRIVETAHFYCFANIKEEKHRQIAQKWNEELFYDRVSRMLMHKDGDKLWNNKCPIYYFEKFSQFQKFAAVIDHSPGSGNSGGYFSADGRDVHVCIPFMTEQLGEKGADHSAQNTVVHEGTHAFLQLTGEDVPLSRWLHEGLAQFMEFWVEKEQTEHQTYGAERQRRSTDLVRLLKQVGVPTWKEMQQRPAGGMDLEGYAFAWSKLEFLYRSFPDHQCLPRMIKAIKAGKSEEEAMQQAFGHPADELEKVYTTWVRDMAKRGFKFD